MNYQRQSAWKNYQTIMRQINQDEKTQRLTESMEAIWYFANRIMIYGAELEDLISVGLVGILKANQTYNSERDVKFSTYASHCIENEIRMYIRKILKRKNEIDINEVEKNDLIIRIDKNYHNHCLLEGLEINLALSALPKMERAVIELRFGIRSDENSDKSAGCSQLEIAQILGLSQSYISRLEKSALKHLRKMLE